MQLLESGHGLPLLGDASRNSRRCASGRRRKAGPSATTAAGAIAIRRKRRQACSLSSACAHPRSGETRHPRPGTGRGGGRRRSARRHGAAACRRHSHLYAGGRRRRPRYGRHARASAATTTSRTPSDSTSSTGVRLAAAGVRPRAAYPRRRRGQAFKAARCSWRRRLPRHGLPSRSVVQLPPAAGMEPRRRRNHRAGSGGGVVRSGGDRPLTRPLRLRQARPPERSLPAPRRSRSTCRAGRGGDGEAARWSAVGRGSPSACGMDCPASGSSQDDRRTCRQRDALRRRRAAADLRQGTLGPERDGSSIGCEALQPVLRAAGRLDGGRTRTDGAGSCRNRTYDPPAKLGRSRPAAAGGAHRCHRFAADLRRHGDAGSRPGLVRSQACCNREMQWQETTARTVSA